MLELLKMLFDWPSLSTEIGIDAVIYSALAIAGTGLFIMRFLLAVVVGIDGDADLDSDGGDSDVAHDGGLHMFSLLSVTAFMMGSGWMGLTARIDWELGPTPTAFIAGGFGLALMFFASFLLLGMRKLGREVTYDARSALGRTGTAYMSIPKKGDGTGKIQISVSGRSMIMNAGSTGEEIAAFTDVRVVDVRDDDLLIVERISDFTNVKTDQDKPDKDEVIDV